MTPAGWGWIASNQKWKPSKHHLYLNNKLLDVAAGRTRRLMVFMPPQHGKSTLVSQYFASWYLGTHPEHRLILVSYAGKYAASWGAKARDTFAEYAPSIFGLELRQDVAAAEHWNIAKHRGGMEAVGIGGSLTGKSANGLVIDDPFANSEQAKSKTYRDKVWELYESAAYTRLSPKGFIVIVNTRWHEDDLCGRLLAQDKDAWEVVSLPAIAEEHDALGRMPGDALWPQQYSLDDLLERKRNLTPYYWNALYQQRPSPENGSTFKREYFAKRYRELPQLQQTVIAVDSAFKTGVANDYSVIATWGTDGINYYCLNVWRDRVEFPDLTRAIIDQYNRFRPNAILIEDAASGQSAIQTLHRDTALPVVPVKAKGSKLSRAEAVSPLFEAGKIYLPETAVWIGEFIEEHVSFPNGEHDDMVDTSAHALTRLSSHSPVSTIPNIWDTESEQMSANIWDAEPSTAIWQ